MKPAIIRPDLELKKEIRNVSERNVIYIRLTGDYKLNDYGGTWMRLFQFIKEEKLPMGDMSPYCIYHDDPKVTFKLYETLNHLAMPGEGDGNLAEYQQPNHVDPQLINDVAGWIKAR